MNAVIGQSAVLLGLLASVGGILTLGRGLHRRDRGLMRAGRTSVWLLVGAAVVAVTAMERGLITHDFSLKFVAENGSRQTPLMFTISSLWGALAGSILLWTLVLTLYIAAVIVKFRARAEDPLVAWATLVMFSVSAFFFALMLGPANPFTRTAGPTPLNGPGPNPLLQNHPLMVIHPPMLYAGYVGFTVPFAFAVAALVTGRLGEGWLVETRRWTLVAWMFLSIGIVLGAWWSYEVLGWGGYWAWDPVENASFIPWLTATAFLHSVMVQERRGMLRIWNLSLVLATFSLTILGTFLTRSGVLDSVHAFTNSDIGPWILTFFAVIVGVSIALIGWRGDQLRSPGSIDSPVSREGAFLFNNLLFAGFAFVVLLGTVFPLIVEALNNDKLTIGGPYFNAMTQPIALALLFLMAVAPALPWRKASASLLRDRVMIPAWAGGLTVVACVIGGLRGWAPLTAFGLAAFAGSAAIRQLVLSARRSGVRRGLLGRANGGMVVHLGVVVIAVAFSASQAYGHRAEFQLRPGQSVTFAGHRFALSGIRTVQHPSHASLVADVQIDGGRTYRPALSNYTRQVGGAIGTPSVRSGLYEDVYLSIAAPPTNPGDPLVLSVIVQPLIVWLWIGGLLVAVGTLLAIIPGSRRDPILPASAPVSRVPVATG
ncbi:MAG: heme lyase CcmF/NrfE family subunit [Acidimicrobiales bacterium]